MAGPAVAKRPCNQPSSGPSSSSSCRDPKRHRPITAPAPTMEKHDEAAGPAPSPSQSSQPLLPGLPDHLAQLCLAPLPPRLLHAVCRPWRRLLHAPSFPPFLALYALLEDAGDGAATFAAYDPVAARWDALPAPPMPSPPPTLWHRSFLSRRLPLQCVAAADRLVLVAGSTKSLHPALCRPLVFDPAEPRWHVGPRIPLAPRRWCAAGAARGRVFVAGGVGACYDLAVARSGASWDPAAGPSAAWEAVPPLRNGRFSRDAAQAVCSGGGKVCMVSLRGRGAKEGAVLDLDDGRWKDMPPGMLAGWNGPAAASPDTGDTMFLVDEESGALNAYDWEVDRWRTVAEAERLKGASEMAAGGGRVCVVADGGKKVVVVDVTALEGRESTSTAVPRMWEVEAPAGRRVVSLHVLPRMTRPE